MQPHHMAVGHFRQPIPIAVPTAVSHVPSVMPVPPVQAVLVQHPQGPTQVSVVPRAVQPQYGTLPTGVDVPYSMVATSNPAVTPVFAAKAVVVPSAHTGYERIAPQTPTPVQSHVVPAVPSVQPLPQQRSSSMPEATAANGSAAPKSNADKVSGRPRHSRELQMTRFKGTVKSFDPVAGFGFIRCAPTYRLYKTDVFLHRHQHNGVTVGDRVYFQVHRNSEGRPQAFNVRKACSSESSTTHSGEDTPPELVGSGGQSSESS
eukprot:TRINITY_DN11005_c0_g1_i1.p1 TRINITY_DN11005_c0_g1~~TRINITY_DN11005_c0_g1_i1.p1  ORF type:complete len:261 (+),score=14.88 TRINITY_DN11005_c0_g1_i1:84-866(+)